MMEKRISVFFCVLMSIQISKCCSGKVKKASDRNHLPIITKLDLVNQNNIELDLQSIRIRDANPTYRGLPENLKPSKKNIDNN